LGLEEPGGDGRVAGVLGDDRVVQLERESPTTTEHSGFEAVAFAMDERDRRSRPVLGG